MNINFKHTNLIKILQYYRKRLKKIQVQSVKGHLEIV